MCWQVYDHVYDSPVEAQAAAGGTRWGSAQAAAAGRACEWEGRSARALKGGADWLSAAA